VADFGIALGSSGPPENVELMLERLGVADRFDAVVTGMDVRVGKPDPQVFLLAAARLRVPPERCAVVEDAPLGIEAAQAAGAGAIALVSTGRTRESLAAADLVVDRLDEISAERIEDLILRRLQANGDM
jgi:beta-phosphoglucomutase